MNGDSSLYRVLRQRRFSRKVADPALIPAGYYTANFDGSIKGIPCVLSRTGYTGEDGFEIYMPADKAADVWEILIEAGKEEGLLPCGLGARDTLRMEAAMPLYGHDMNDDISPKIAGLGFAIKMDSLISSARLQLRLQLHSKREELGSRLPAAELSEKSVTYIEMEKRSDTSPLEHSYHI